VQHEFLLVHRRGPVRVVSKEQWIFNQLDFPATRDGRVVFEKLMGEDEGDFHERSKSADGGKPAVGAEDLAGKELGGVREEEGHELRDIVGIADLLERVAFGGGVLFHIGI
jgi:hypothetical protein